MKKFLELNDKEKETSYIYNFSKTKKEKEIEEFFPKLKNKYNTSEKTFIENLDKLFLEEKSNSNRGIYYILKKAIQICASDIHFENLSDKLRVRFRINGLLKDIYFIDKSFSNTIISKIKILSGLDIVEKRRPQDGRFSLLYNADKNNVEREIDFRTSIIPTMNGEKVVLRLLDKFNYQFSIDSLGLNQNHKKIFLEGINQNNGIILVNGPTGSGKSTTLYSILKYKNSEFVNISTVEDPIEYQIDGINQIQCKTDIGLNFSSILRSILRQDPDIIMVGEIRDKETAEIAVKASLTGHLVFSTLHSNNSLGCINRLLNLDVDSYLLSLVLVMIISQRLVRILCPKCKKVDENYKEKLDSLKIDYSKFDKNIFYTHCGCEECFDTGYIGRTPIFEIFLFDKDLKEMIVKKESVEKIYKVCMEKGIKTLLDNAIEKATLGITSLDEIMRQL